MPPVAANGTRRNTANAGLRLRNIQKSIPRITATTAGITSASRADARSKFSNCPPHSIR